MNLTNVEYNIKETNQIILENITKMFERRNMISSKTYIFVKKLLFTAFPVCKIEFSHRTIEI